MNTRKVKIKKNAIVLQDFHQFKWGNDNIVFDAITFTEKSWQLKAKGYGSAYGEDYGNGALYVNEKDLIDVPNVPTKLSTKSSKNNKQLQIGIVGRGIVGNALAYGLEKTHNIISYDKYKQSLFQTIEDVAKCDIVFFCVPTPMDISGKIDLSPLQESIKSVHSLIKTNKETKIFVIKSTATSGTTSSFQKTYPNVHWVFCPEFLTERNANEDFVNTDRIIIGTHSHYAYDKLKTVFEKAGFKCPIVQTEIKIAEMAKYASNTFLACKVAFANELYEICQRENIDYNALKDILLLDERIGKTHLDVPGIDGDRGFGGKCFPKDINALIYHARSLGYFPYLLEEIWRSNLNVRKNKDW